MTLANSPQMLRGVKASASEVPCMAERKLLIIFATCARFPFDE